MRGQQIRHHSGAAAAEIRPWLRQQSSVLVRPLEYSEAAGDGPGFFALGDACFIRLAELVDETWSPSIDGAQPALPKESPMTKTTEQGPRCPLKPNRHTSVTELGRSRKVSYSLNAFI